MPGAAAEEAMGSAHAHAPATPRAKKAALFSSNAHAHAPPLKYVVLLLCSALTLGSTYCYHNPSALKNQLQQHFSATLQKDQYEVLFVSFPSSLSMCMLCCTLRARLVRA
jgi:hypothetical protein